MATRAEQLLEEAARLKAERESAALRSDEAARRFAELQIMPEHQQNLKAEEELKEVDRIREIREIFQGLDEGKRLLEILDELQISLACRCVYDRQDYRHSVSLKLLGNNGEVYLECYHYPYTDIEVRREQDHWCGAHLYRKEGMVWITDQGSGGYYCHVRGRERNTANNAKFVLIDVGIYILVKRADANKIHGDYNYEAKLVGVDGGLESLISLAMSNAAENKYVFKRSDSTSGANFPGDDNYWPSDPR